MALDARKRLARVTLDENSIGRGSADQEHERAIAIYDLIEDNSFGVVGHDGGPYALNISLHDAKLALDVTDEEGKSVVTHILSLTPFRRILKDYFMICETLLRRDPARDAEPQSRRSTWADADLHNEGAHAAARAAEGQDRDRHRHFTPHFHAGDGSALEGLTMPAQVQPAPVETPRVRPQSVLFACTLNTVRSPMAEALARHYFGREIYFASAGLKRGEPDRIRDGRDGGDRHRHRAPQARTLSRISKTPTST